MDQAAPHLAPFLQLPPEGSCTAFPNFFDTSDLSDLPLQVWSGVLGDAPTAGVGDIEVAGKLGRRQIAQDQPFPRYAELLGGTHPYHAGEPLPDFLDPGELTVSGSGDEGIGKFTAAASMPVPVIWKNPEKFEIVDRGRSDHHDDTGNPNDDPCQPVSGHLLVGRDSQRLSQVLGGTQFVHRSEVQPR